MSKEDKKKRIGRHVDKFIMGAIIGGAIGSVIGMVAAPQEGKKTRKIIKEKGRDLLKKRTLKGEGKQIFSFIKTKVKKIQENREMARMTDEEDAQKIPHEE
ncbi:MAG: YtxH domain-containing protein [Patescibacteria group bacterium]|nr:YtxH domain-containing protein [Patescibacteria group bacterium]